MIRRPALLESVMHLEVWVWYAQGMERLAYPSDVTGDEAWSLLSRTKMSRNYITYISALLLFGSNGIVASYISLNSYKIVFLRTIIGSLFLIPRSSVGHR